MSHRRDRASRRAATRRICARRRSEYKDGCRKREDELTDMQPGRFKKNTPWAFAATPKRLHGRPRVGYEMDRVRIYQVRREARTLRDAVRSGRFDLEGFEGKPDLAAVINKLR